MEDENILDLLVPVFAAGLDSKCLDKLADGLKKSKCITEDNANAIKALSPNDFQQKILELIKAIKERCKAGWRISFVTLVQNIVSEKNDLLVDEVATITEKAFEPESTNLLWMLKSWHLLNGPKNRTSLKNAANFLKKLERTNILLHVCNYVAESEPNSKTVLTFVETMKSAILPVQSEDNSKVDSIMSSLSSLLPRDIELPGTIYKSVETKLEPLCPMLSDILNDEQIRDLATDLYNNKHISKEQCQIIGCEKSKILTKLTGPDLIFKLLESLKVNAKENWKNDFLESIKNLDVAVLYELMSRCLISNNSPLCYLCQNWELFKQKRDIVTQVARQQLPMFDESEKLNQADWLLKILSVSVNVEIQSLQLFVKTLQSSLNVFTYTEKEILTTLEDSETVTDYHSKNNFLSHNNETECQQQQNYQNPVSYQKATPAVCGALLHRNPPLPGVKSGLGFVPEHEEKNRIEPKLKSNKDIVEEKEKNREVVESERQDFNPKITNRCVFVQETVGSMSNKEKEVLKFEKNQQSKTQDIILELKKHKLQVEGKIEEEVQKAATSNKVLFEIQTRIDELHQTLKVAKADIENEEAKKLEKTSLTMVTSSQKTKKENGVNEKSTKQNCKLKGVKNYAENVKKQFLDLISFNSGENKQIQQKFDFVNFETNSEMLSDFSRKPPKEKYILEFQVMVNNMPKLLEGDVLVLLDVDTISLYPLYFCPIRNQYAFQIELNEEQNKFKYKYLFCKKDSPICWELLPGKKIYNRKLELSQDMIKRGHVIVFDFIQTKPLDKIEYKKSLQKNFHRFLPSFEQIEFNGDSKIPITFFIRILSDWVHACEQGMFIQALEEYYPKHILNIKNKDHSLDKYVHEMTEHMTKDNSNISRCKRILGMFVLLCLMENRHINSENKQTKVDICYCLSFHDIDKDAQVLLIEQLKKFILCHKSMMDLLHNAMSKLDSIPQILLAFPLYLTVFDIYVKTNQNTQMFASFRFKDLQKYRTPENQRILLALGPIIASLLSEFPSLQIYYQQMLSLESTKIILVEKKHQKLLNGEGIAKKLIFMWSQLASHKPIENITEEIFVVISSHFQNFLSLQLAQQNGYTLIFQNQFLLSIISNNCFAENVSAKFQQFQRNINVENIYLFSENLNKFVHELQKYFKAFEKILEKLILYCENNVKFHTGFVSNTFSLIDELVRIVTILVNKNIADDKLLTTVKNNIKELNNVLISTINNIFNNVHVEKISPETVMFWNVLIIDWSDKKFKENWMKICHQLIRKQIIEVFESKLPSLLEFYAKQLEDMKPHAQISEWFSVFVLDMVEKEPVNNKKENTTEVKESVWSSPSMKKVCQKVFLKQWNHVRSNHQDFNSGLLELLESWKPVVTILKILNSMIKQIELPLTDIIDKIKNALSCIGDTIIDGNITVYGFEQIYNYRNTFLNTLNAMVGSSVDGSDNLDKVFDIRQQELKSFRTLKQGIQSFVDIMDIVVKCAGVQVNKYDLQQSLGKEVKDLKLNELVSCSYDINAPIDVIYFKLQNQQQDIFTNIVKTKALNSKLVKIIVREFSQNLPNELKEENAVLDVDAVIENIWKPTLQFVCKLVDTINNGEILFYTLKKYFRKLNDVSIIDTELNKLLVIHKSLNNKDVQSVIKSDRKEQLHIFLQMNNNIKAVKIIDRLKENLNLEGKFSVLKIPLDMQTKEKKNTLSLISSNLIEASNVIKSITPERCNAIKTFLEKEKLLSWLKENIKDINEVKVLSDLAMISAGQIPMQVDRVSCFFSAVMGFAPLIFDLPQTAGFDELITACETVWINIQQDPKLLQNWLETGKQLEWLCNVKDLHGSVEKSSLTKAQKINTSGVYKIGGENNLTPTVENSMKLVFVNFEQKINKDRNNPIDFKEMASGDLKDLQSRLMLIAGEAKKGKQDVDVFIKMLSSVENLTKAYVKLKSSGCLLFQNWSATVICSDTSGEHQTLSVYFDSESPAITSRENALKEVVQLTKVLNDAHDNWKNYLSTKRTEHYHLNHYNIHQLTYLCKQLAKCDEDGEITDQVHVLLSFVKKNLDCNKIVETLKQVSQVHNAEEKMCEIADVIEISIIEKKRKVVHQIIQRDVQENIAKAAVQKQSSRNLDFDECFLMSLKIGYEPDEVNKYERLFDQEAEFESNANNINVIQDIVDGSLKLSFQEVVEKIQSVYEHRTFGSKINTICKRYLKNTLVTSLKDCVSLECLGKFLAMLSDSVPPDQMIKRGWPDHFIAGKPNLVLCPEADIWRSILSIYCHSPECELPSIKEVLVCTENTTSEEVELLLRRAMCTADNRENVFCLACADQLKFNVAQNTEKIFQQLSQSIEKNSEYRLIIITSSTHHYTTCCFDEFQVDKSFIKMEDEIKEYLAKHLTAKHVKESASCVNPDQSIVRVVTSNAAGMGKSLYITRCRENLERMSENNFVWNSSIVRFLEKSVNTNDVINSLFHENADIINSEPHFIHLDITPSVQTGVYPFLFNLIFLGSVQNSKGVVWKREPSHFYAIEYTLPETEASLSFFNLLTLLPNLSCLSPMEVCQILQDESPIPPNVKLMDTDMLKSEVYQRPIQYLLRYANNDDLGNFAYKTPILKALKCLQTLLKFCSVEQPSWAELDHFTKFLNVQLSDCEKSMFCNAKLVQGLETDLRRLNDPKVWDSGLNEFKEFVVRFMIRMSQDFSTPSNNKKDQPRKKKREVFELYQLRRSWESNPHPYLFFNHDRVSMSFVHFHINRNGNLCHPKTKQVIENNVMSETLFYGLKSQGIELQQDFDLISRNEKLQTLCQVFGVENVFDPDPTYELTTDNVLKMLAIHMRFRCGIPVIIMGETGCGKTRMIEFMCRLKAGGNKEIRNMMIVKVHGGITVSIIQDKVRDAINMAKANSANGKDETILFLDEANTTEAIYAIKEVVCDGSVNGEEFKDVGLRIVAACNPYRKHSNEVIKSMEKSGLGFNVKAEDTKDKFAGIPMRHLVYRVVALPPSMLPLVWDFGQLSNEAEGIYIKQMVLKLQNEINACKDLLILDPNMNEVITKALITSQDYMRNLKDWSSFVSLRDVERTIQSYKWFYQHLVHLNPMINKAKNEDRKCQNLNAKVDHAYRALILSLGMCYHAPLIERKKYRQVITQAISDVHTIINEEEFLMEIIACQNVFIDSVDLEKNIARNEALRENVFMIVVCAEMRIPLFLVGKPGSSKSLAKTVATDAMRGQTSNNELFKKLKQIQVLSFQCSPVSDAVGIETVFSQCAQLQKNQDLNKYVAVVVLDEIGLAEDSPKMPLKVLHSLLEAGSTQSSNIETEAYNKVGFVGISNWSLDPAKMNRGIFVTRSKPSKEDLQKTAKGIFESNENKIQLVEGMIKSVTNAYLEIYEKQDKEFFGLRDYYALLKMMFSLVSKDNEIESYQQIGTLVLRNFSGHQADTLSVFRKHLSNDFNCTYNINISVIDLIKQNFDLEYESRFLLLLTNQYAAISLLNKVMDGKDYVVIFGSSFPRDCDYTEICRNINRIKMCMESGKPVVLLNLRDLYESLYDALNQHYVTFAGQRYVDLGLGGHRVKCRIAEDFRLIVIEEKEVVYKEFPIPLINRLEKHIFEMSSLLTPEQETLVNMLKKWVEKFSQIKDKLNKKMFAIEDTFAGHQNDTAASAVLKCANQHTDDLKKRSKLVLLQSASYDGVCRLPKSRLERGIDEIQNTYFNIQHHDTLVNLLKHEILKDTTTVDYISVFEITSFSHILNDQDRKNFEYMLQLPNYHVMLINLLQFQTEQEYTGRLNEFLKFSVSRENLETTKQKTPYVLLIQCTNSQENSNLISCGKYSALNKIKSIKNEVAKLSLRIIICFLFTLERHSDNKKERKSFTSFHSKDCTSIFVDELQTSKNHIGSINSLQNKTILQVIKESLQMPKEDSNEENCQLDLNILIRQCTPESVSKLINKTQNFGRNRVKILFKVCFNNENISYQFFGILLNRIFLLLKEREKFISPEESWIVTEACSSQALQEGGTFTNTLWLKLRKVTAIALAKIISVVDVDNNLNILIESKSNHILKLWLTIFSSVHYCKIMFKANFAGAQFIIENKANFANKFPFSRMILDILSRQWFLASVVFLDNSISENNLFLNGMERARIYGFLVKAVSHNAREVLELFVHDLVYLYYKSQTEDTNYEMEFQAVQDSLISFFNVKRRNSITHKNPLVQVFVLFMSIHAELIQFSKVVASCSDILVHRGDWVDQQELNTSFMLHASAFSSMVSYIKEQASGIDKVDTCQLWKYRVMKVRQVSDKIIASGQVPEDIQTTWKHLVFVDLFINQLIPTLNTSSQHYLSTLAPLARGLWKGASITQDMSGVIFLKIITTTLQGCTKDVRLKILCKWEDLKCKSCNADKVDTPVKFPCGHFFCQKCVPVNEDVVNCPKCRKAVANFQDLTPVELNKEQTKEYESFKNSCTSFFLEYLSTFCFPTEKGHNVNLKPLDQKVFEILENLVICNKKTKIISPLQSNFDESPTARSYILQLLLRCKPELVQTQLNHHFQSMGDVLQDKTVLMGVYIQCIQDKLNNELRLGWNSVEYTVYAEFALHIFEECQKLIKSTRNFNQVQHLDMCAKLQFVTRECLKCIKAIAENKPKNFEDHQNMELLINRLCMFCKTKKYLIIQQYLIKCLCRRHGVGDFDFLLNNENYKKCLIPENLLPPEDADDSNLYRQSDLFILIGDIYTQAKLLFLGIASEDDLPGLVQKLIHLIQQSNDSLIQIGLALSAWCIHGNVTNQLKMEAKNYIYHHLQLNQPEKINQQLFEDISKGELNVYQPLNATANLHYKVVELISMAGIAFHNKAELTKFFSQIIVDPHQIPNMFLPTMPQSSFFEVQDVLKQEISNNVSPKAYMCPNNHVYFIGECTNPVQAGTCPECKCKIGGQKYGLLHEGNRVGDLTEASQAGYLLGESTQITVAPERKLTKLSVCAIRICLHASFLLNARQNNNLNRILKINGGQAEVIQFLLGHLVKDLTNLGTFLGKSLDDTLIIVHQILHKIRISQTNPAENNCSLASMKNRVIWEEMFQKTFLSLVFKDTEKIIQESQNALNKAGKLAEEPLQRLVFELNEEVPVIDGIVPWDHPNLWKYKVNIDMKHLRQKLEAVDAKAGGEGSILKPLLGIENLNYVQYIEDIAYVQSVLIKRYTQRIDIPDSDKITLNDFLKKDKNLLQDKLNTYITIWNKIRNILEKADLYNTNREYFREDMTLNSPISMCLPNNRGRGCCGLVFIEYLINIQNNLLADCRDNIVPKPTFELCDVAKVGRENLVCIEEERDLMPLVLANSQYEATAGNKEVTGITYNVGLLEKKVVEKFILRKAIINIKSIPRMQYPQDMGLKNEWKTIKSLVEQVPLPQRMCTMIDENAEKGRTADICEAVRTLTLVVQFVSRLGGEPSQVICEYAEKDIMLPVDETNNIFIPKTAQIKHCLSLFERLSWHRALRLFGNEQNPFENILVETEDINDAELETELRQNLLEMNIQRLQFELNALLMLGPEANSSWGLSVVLLAYLEQKYDNEDLNHSWCEKLPEEILYKHAVHVFSLSIEVQANN